MRVLARASMALSLWSAILLTGCGGSDSVQSPNFRMVQTGDRWVMAGQRVSAGVTTEFTDTVEIASEELGGAIYPSFRHTIAMDGQPDSVSADIVSQNPQTRDITMVGNLRPDGSKNSLTPRLLMPGTIYLGREWRVDYSDDVTNYVVCRITGRENVATPAGTFLAWKVHVTINAGAFSGTNDSWLVPEIGNFVKIITNTGQGAGASTSTEVLTSTTVPIPIFE